MISTADSDCICAPRMPHNGATLSGESALKRLAESTAADARLHESSYPEPKGRRIEGGEARDGRGDGLVRLQRFVMRRARQGRDIGTKIYRTLHPR